MCPLRQPCPLQLPLNLAVLVLVSPPPPLPLALDAAQTPPTTAVLVLVLVQDLLYLQVHVRVLGVLAVWWRLGRLDAGAPRASGRSVNVGVIVSAGFVMGRVGVVMVIGVVVRSTAARFSRDACKLAARSDARGQHDSLNTCACGV